MSNQHERIEQLESTVAQLQEQLRQIIALFGEQQGIIAELMHSQQKRGALLKVLVDHFGARDPAILAALIDAAGGMQEMEHVFRLQKPRPQPPPRPGA